MIFIPFSFFYLILGPLVFPVKFIVALLRYPGEIPWITKVGLISKLLGVDEPNASFSSSFENSYKEFEKIFLGWNREGHFLQLP